MTPLSQVELHSYPLDRFITVVDLGAYERARTILEESRDLLAGRVVWHVNSTAEGAASPRCCGRSWRTRGGRGSMLVGP